MTFTTEEREHLAIRGEELPDRPITQEQAEHLAIAKHPAKSAKPSTPRAPKKGKA